MKVQHVGVYGIIGKGDRLLVVRKSRGPYKGLLDLPGGRTLHGEELLTALSREIMEETGIIAKSFLHVANHSFLILYTNENDQACELYHIAMLYRVKGADVSGFKSTITAEDVQGALWVSKDTLSSKNSSPLVLANCFAK